LKKRQSEKWPPFLFNKTTSPRSCITEDKKSEMMKKYFPFLIAVLWMSSVGAAPVDSLQPVEKIIVLLIVDNSGSMKTSDSTDLRFTGVRLFASLLDSNDSLSLIIFSTESKLLAEDSAKLLEHLQAPAANGYTNIKAALEDAKELLKDAKLHDGKVVIVLLTDGKPEIPNPYPQYERETLDLARSLNVPIMAIALTSAAQTPFLDQLALTTNGVVIPADNASDLLNHYLQILGQIKDRTVIAGEKNKSNGALKIEQTIAPYVNSATFVFAKPENTEVRLLGPNGNEITGDISSDPRFSLFTLENPVGGTYSFRAQGGGQVQAWAILRSRLRVQIVEPDAIHPSDRELPVIVNLLEETTAGNFIKIIGDANFTALVTAPDGSETSLDRFYDDGTHGDITADDGNYTRIFPAPKVEGVYQIAVQGWKDAIPVQAETRVKVTKFPELIVDFPQEKVEVRDTAVELQVHLDGAEIFDQGEVIARVTSPSGQVDEIVLTGSGIYLGEFFPVEDGEYHVTFETRDAKFQGVDFQTQVEDTFDVTVIPFVSVFVNKINAPDACFSTANEFSVLLSVASSGEENLYFSVPDGWQVNPDSLKVTQGQQDIQLRLLAPDGLSEDAQRVEILVEGRDRLEVQPDARIGFDIQIPGLFTRCRTPIKLSIVIFLLAVVGVISIQRKRKASLPPPVSGTLRHWKIGENPALAIEIDLTAFGKESLLIGNGATSDVMIPNADLDSEHARIWTEKMPEGVEMVLEPIGEVRKGYSQQNVRFVLRHGETFRMGAHEFQFLSDSGQ
jgi:hypothetical protein